MDYENDYEEESHEPNYDSDFEDVEGSNNNMKGKTKNHKNPDKPISHVKKHSNAKEVTDEYPAKTKSKKHHSIRSKDKDDSEEMYDDSFSADDFEEGKKSDMPIKKPEPLSEFGTAKRKSDSEDDEYYEEKGKGKSMIKKLKNDKEIDKGKKKQDNYAKGTKSPILPPRVGGLNKMKTPREDRSVEKINRNSSSKERGMIKNSTQDKLKSKSDLPKKNRKQLEKENHQLRKDLQDLNEALNKYIESVALNKKKMKKVKRNSSDPKMINDQNTDKRLKIYESEYMKIKEKHERINNPSYILTLKEDIKNKEKKLSELEKTAKIMSKDQNSRGKNLENYDDKLLVEEKAQCQQLEDEFNKLDEQIKIMERNIEKEQNWYESNCSKEADLQNKLEKLKVSNENYQQEPVVDKKLASKYSNFVSALQNLEKIRTNTAAQMKVQENTLKNHKDALQKEIDLVNKQSQEKSTELNKIRRDLENVMEIAKANNMKGLVSMVNIPKRPSSESSSSPRLLNEKSGGSKKIIPSQKDLKIGKMMKNNSAISLKNINGDYQGKNIALNMQKSSDKPLKMKIFDGSVENKGSKDKIIKDAGLDKGKNNGNSVLEEKKDSKLKKEQKKGNALKELDEDNEKLKKSMEKSIKEDKKSKRLDAVEKEKKEEVKSIGLKNLEANNKIEAAKDKSPIKPSIFDELEKESKPSTMRKPEVQPKPSLFEDLDKNHKPETISKPSIFDELEQESEPKNNFKPIAKDKKPSIFDELEDKPNHDDNDKNQLGWKGPDKSKPYLFQELESKPSEDRGFKPIRSIKDDELSHNQETGHKNPTHKGFAPFNDNEGHKKPNDLDTNEHKIDPFNKIELPDPSKKRNRAHLSKKNDDKIAELAENASKNNGFGNILDSNEPEKVNFNVQSKLLPVNKNVLEKEEPKFANFDMKRSDTKKSETKNHPPKSKKVDLEEEDLLL
ncbi:hypothetical protein SteCoe_3232 [Stentor coeruleus]|uniref:Uncharacterized protein n=1 Tax=Stentor coeruleus TaxID=5963 RepID=A0A1R2CXT1_9CILI|nr:hypothetical protein SteCoe_3232 [Stentor coeruleus]